MSAIPAPQEQVIPSGRNLAKAAILLALMLGSFALVQHAVAWTGASGLVPWLQGPVQWVLVAVFAAWNSMLLIGMGVLAHDAVHRVLFRSRFWNELGGGLLSAMALLPFEANRQLHLTHHGNTHRPGWDPEEKMHRYPFLVAFVAGAPLALVEHGRILLQSLRRIAERRHAVRLAKDALFLSAAGAFYFGLVPAMGFSTSLTVTPMLLALPLVFSWRALSDHYGLPAIERPASHSQDEVDAEAWHRNREQRSREVTGWVVLTSPWLEWLWSHVNYHEVHHKYPWLSHIHLKAAFEATRTSRPYLVVHGYWRSLWSLRNRSYYERRERLRQYLTTPDWQG